MTFDILKNDQRDDGTELLEHLARAILAVCPGQGPFWKQRLCEFCFGCGRSTKRNLRESQNKWRKINKSRREPLAAAAAAPPQRCASCQRPSEMAARHQAQGNGRYWLARDEWVAKSRTRHPAYVLVCFGMRPPKNCRRHPPPPPNEWAASR